METKKRSIAKSLTWRTLGVVMLLIIGYLITGNIKDTGIITVIFHGLRMILYYIHERLWLKVKWGKIEHPLCEIPVTGKLKSADKSNIEEMLRDNGHL